MKNSTINDPKWTPNSIRTYTGKVFDLAVMDPDSICIEDIAHGLANTARFAGQLPKIYTVAQHSWLVSDMASEDMKLTALLHDASEAYLGDMPSPFKSMMPDFKALENKLMSVIAKKFDINWPIPASVKVIDNYHLNLEWDCFVDKTSARIAYWKPIYAESMFLGQYYKILKNRKS